MVFQKLRIWKSGSNNVDEITELEKKYRNFTTVKCDGLLLEDEKVEDMNIASDDILIVELPKEGEWVFSNEKEKAKIDIDSPSPTQTSSSNSLSIKEITDLDIQECLTGKSRRGLVGLSNLGNTCFMNSGL